MRELQRRSRRCRWRALLAHHGGLAPGARFIEKSFTPAELGRKVREALNDPAR